MLLPVNAVKRWRHSYDAPTYLYDVAAATLVPVLPAGAAEGVHVRLPFALPLPFGHEPSPSDMFPPNALPLPFIGALP